MGFHRRSEVGLDAQMNLQPFLLEPDATALGETGRFGSLSQPQNANIESPRRLLSVRRHCQLHMFNRVDFHLNSGFSCEKISATGLYFNVGIGVSFDYFF